ncbi:hypothetical protein [Nostoc sp. C117]|uniref:hypothetical protein n=1 Tax=Nostoc sp. C117 TaxID=3349875 RepID=UPI00370D7DF9
MGNYIPPRDEQGKQLPPTSNIPTGEPLDASTPSVVANTPPVDSLPDDFKPFDHLQAVYIPQFNVLVRRFFGDLPDDWKPNIATARSSLRVACTMLNEDNHAMMYLRSSLFFDLLGYGRKDLIVYHGAVDSLTQPVDGHPKVVFYFSQNKADVGVDEQFVDMECSFRLMTETPETFTKENALAIANQVKTEMTTGGKGITFIKGKNIYNYKHEEKGYRLLIRGSTEADSIDLIQRLLRIQEVAFDENRLSVSEPKKSNTTTPTTHTVYGKTIKKPRFRPTATLHFRYAYVEVPGLKNNIFLVDTTHRHTALVAA